MLPTGYKDSLFFANKHIYLQKSGFLHYKDSICSLSLPGVEEGVECLVEFSALGIVVGLWIEVAEHTAGYELFLVIEIPFDKQQEYLSSEFFGSQKIEEEAVQEPEPQQLELPF